MNYDIISRGDRFIGTLFLALAIGAAYWVGTIWLNEKDPEPPVEIHLDEDILTLQMIPSVLMDAINEDASQWCVAEREFPVVGDIVLKSVESGIDTYDQVFLTDSMAPKMAAEYSHFKYSDKDGVRQFTLPATAGTVTVPAWLVKTLIEMNVLKLPKEEQDRRKKQQ